MTVVIGLDLGTTACKAVALAVDGRVLAATDSTYPMHHPQPGRSEQDVHDVWRGAAEALRALAEQCAGQEFAALCLSGAMHSALPVDDAGEPLAPAMTWADNRAAATAERLRRECDAHAVYERTGCPLRSTYHPARLRWWGDEAPGIARRAARFAMIKDWVLFQLTGQWAIDLGMASTSGLLNIHTLQWDDEALALAGVEAGQLPRLTGSKETAGMLTPAAADRTGLPAGLPVIAAGSDGGLANLGAGVTAPGQYVITVGTSGAMRKAVQTPHLDPAVRTWCYLLAEGHYFAGGALNNGGLALQWVRDGFYGELDGEAGYARLLDDAANIPVGADGLLLLPYLTGERSPHWRPDLSATAHGLRLGHTRAHLARAALEGVAFCLADIFEALHGEDEAMTGPVRLTGGVTRDRLWGQIIADVLGAPLSAVEVADASAIGAAALGHWALGHLPALACPVPVTEGDAILPDAERHTLYQAQHRAFQDLFRRLTE